MQIRELTHDDILRILPDRIADSHKGDYGKILLLCGSVGYTGAAALAAMGALRSGAGLVFLGVLQSIYEIEAIKLTEPVVFPLTDDEGMFDEAAVREILDRLKDIDAVLVGPGCGQSKGVFCVVKAVLESFHGPVVLDADGINVLRQNIDIVRDRTSPTIITPHMGEFKRIGAVQSGDRICDAVQTARDLGCVVLLKGNRTVITDGSTCYINPTGNAGMSVGGSGDVLSGMIVSLLGQGIAALESAAAAAWLHGAAGDVCAQQMGQYGMLPSDILQVLPRLMK